MFASQVHQGDWTLFVCVAPLATSFGQTLNEAAINTPQLTKSATDLAGSVYQCLNATQTYRWHINRGQVSVETELEIPMKIDYSCKNGGSLNE